MIDDFYIAYKYVRFNRIKTTVLVTCITLAAFLPISLDILLEKGASQFTTRATDTPLIAGAEGSELDLVMSAIYFEERITRPVTMQNYRQIEKTGLARCVPLNRRFVAGGFSVVGTTADYFNLRHLQIKRGRHVSAYGECVLGATVSRRLGLEPGDSLQSSPTDVYESRRACSVQMEVVGILEKTYDCDDLAVFTNLETTWLMEGLGCSDKRLANAGDNIVSYLATPRRTEITRQELQSYSFQGDHSHYPVTAILAVPNDDKSEAMLRGRFLSGNLAGQIVKPAVVIEGMLGEIFRITNVFTAVITVVTIATVLAVFLTFAVSVRFRRAEIHTMFRFGCSRMAMARLLAAELCIIALLSAAVCGAMVCLINIYDSQLVRLLFKN